MKKLLPARLRYLIFSSLFLAFVVFLNVLVPTLAQNDRCTDPEAVKSMQSFELSDCIDKLSRAKNQSVAATTGVQKQIAGIKSRVSFIENDLTIKQQQINKSQEELAKIMEILYATIRNYYMGSQGNCPICDLLINPSISEFVKIQAYEKTRIDRDKAFIINTVHSIQTLEERKKELKNEQVNLTSVKVKLDKVVSDSLAYQSTLSSQISQLSARQQEILAQRLASLNIPRSAGTAAPACVSDIGKDPGFGGGFAFFTYGVPNRTGLNQYGAWGRAKAGQDHKTILNAYFSNFELKEDYDENIQIHVVDSGIDMTLSIEDYVKRIYEMPGSWVENDRAALKAQAIAARSYALAYTNNGQNSICATEKCQVFKTDPKGGDWDGAVEATRGDVMVQGGNPVKAWYSSTHGGYILSTSELPGWSSTSWTKHATDTTTGAASSLEDLKNNAYDKDSPWFYCDWGSRSQYNNTAWLKSDELADIANTLLLFKADSSTGEHLYQTDAPNPAGTDNWDAGRVKSELQNRGITPFNNISSTSIGADFGSGRTSSINISGDARSVSFDGGEFKNRFNLRAPKNIQIVGPLYNIERQ